MNRSFLLAAVLGVVLSPSARAQSKPDFTGTWKLDFAKSDPAPAGRGVVAGGSLTIKQVGDDMLIVREGTQGPQTLTYKLDGSESTNAVAGRGGAIADTKSKAKWDGPN